MNRLIDDFSAKLLEIIQSGIPLTSRPFETIAEMLDASEKRVLDELARLKSEGLIRQTGAIFDSAMLGYRGALAAFAVEPALLDEVGRAVSLHEGVSHCYSRDCSFNLWFTITVGPDADLDEEFASLSALTGVNEAHLLPAIKVFKIGVFLPMSGDGAKTRPAARSTPLKPQPLTDSDKQAVRLLQKDMPIVSAPFAALAAEAGIDEDELLKSARSLLERRVMRRFAAVLRHREVGYKANAMLCIHVLPDHIETVADTIASDVAVSHCYQRPTWPGWPYPLYAMTHAKDEAGLQEAIRRITSVPEIGEHAVLRSLKEYKKTRVVYFAAAGKR